MTARQPAIQTRHNQNFIRKALLDVKDARFESAEIMIHDSTVVESGPRERSVAMLITHNLPIETPLTLQRCCHTY